MAAFKFPISCWWPTDLWPAGEEQFKSGNQKEQKAPSLMDILSAQLRPVKH